MKYLPGTWQSPERAAHLVRISYHWRSTHTTLHRLRIKLIRSKSISVDPRPGYSDAADAATTSSTIAAFLPPPLSLSFNFNFRQIVVSS